MSGVNGGGAVAEKREPTDEEWEWVCRRLDARRSSMALLNMVWSAVHEHGWWLPEVTDNYIELRRYDEQIGGHQNCRIWRDSRGHFRSAEFSVTTPTSSTRRIDETIERLA